MSPVFPKHYRLQLEPDLDTFELAGQVEIHLEARQPVHELTVHAVELQIFSIAHMQVLPRTVRFTVDPEIHGPRRSRGPPVQHELETIPDPHLHLRRHRICSQVAVRIPRLQPQKSTPR